MARVPLAAHFLQRGGYGRPISQDPWVQAQPWDHQLPSSGKAFPPA